MTADQFTVASGDPANVSYDDVVVLAAWMAAEGYSAAEVAYAVEKPWKHREEIVRSREAAQRAPAAVAPPG